MTRSNVSAMAIHAATARTARPANDAGELIVDCFAGGGGASTAILAATGRHPDIAINHDAEAIALHAANHPTTRHHCADINEVDPRKAVAEFPGPDGRARPVGLLWASPDCKHHSKARGGKPREKKIRSLAWIVVRWAAQVRPRVIALENVEEFQDWGPLLEADTFIRDDEIESLAQQLDAAIPDEQFSLWNLLDPTEDEIQAAIKPALDRAAELHADLQHSKGKGRLYKAGQPDPRHKGIIFRRWVSQLESFGYAVEWRELVAADYGAPTTRKRLFLIARCDARPIVWPERTHAPRDKAGLLGLQPWLPAASIIDWSIPVPSIFGRKKPLEPKTHARIAKGIKRYVIEAGRPFIVPVTHSTGGERVYDSADPLKTVTAGPKRGEFSLVSPYLTAQYGERDGQEPRARDVDSSPYPTVVPGGNGGRLVEAVLGGAIVGCGGRAGQSPPRGLDDPLGTATAKADKCVASATMAPVVVGTDNFSTRASRAFDPEDPLRTAVSSGGFGVAATFLQKMAENGQGCDIGDPLHTAMAGAPRHYQVAACLNRQFGTGVAQDPEQPMPTVMADGGGGKTQVITAYLGRMAKGSVGSDPADPSLTATTKGKDTLADITIDKYYATGVPSEADEPLDTATTKPRFGLNATYLEQANTGMVGHDAREPVSTIVGKGCTQRLVDCELEGFDAEPSERRQAVLAFLWKHFGEPTADERANPLATPAGRLKFGLVVMDGTVWRIVDIGMRMLVPRELYGAQGFPADYKIEITFEGKPLTKTAQTRMAGNSVSPPPAAALLSVNYYPAEERLAA
ncbi:DNA cytosine methyltransferase [Caulobacter segnis]|uniref:DNA (cytosine-5-)-methyltransferase n=1 Tax=Caulobacter segnis TaxID=88688 RepID=A0A2W5WQN7_9CAUL|nr:DNA cytosine methyltransferase [Caulobacter segnis]PZR36448.1 MAG: hypothetical protein DI526_03150 [Caulobacter segnis]